MKIPEIKEVKEYMTERKKDWSKQFIEYYSDKFWNYYNSQGWKVGRVPMKSWQSAFNAQWQNLKYNEDIAMFNRCQVKMQQEIKQSKVVQMTPKNRDTEYVDEIMREYLQHPAFFPKYRLAACYDWLKENKLIKLTKEEKELALEAGKDDIEKGKALATEFVFNKMMLDCKTFKDLKRGIA